MTYIESDNDMIRLKEENEYFIHTSFTGEPEFLVIDNSVLYCKDEWFTMQSKPNVNEEICDSVNLGLTNWHVSQHPIYSDNSIMFVWENNDNKDLELVVMPEFNASIVPLTSDIDSDLVCKEFFFYSKSINEEFVVHIRRESSSSLKFFFDFYRKNGKFLYTKKHEINDIK